VATLKIFRMSFGTPGRVLFSSLRSDDPGMNSFRDRVELPVEAAQFLGGPERSEGPLKTEGTFLLPPKPYTSPHQVSKVSSL